MNTCNMKSYFPKTSTDACAVIFLIAAVAFTYLNEVLTVVPYIHPTNATLRYLHTLNGTFITYNVFANLWLLVTTDSSITSLMLPSKLMPGWRFCSACEANAPPRSYHCVSCKKCILKRDHHCVFSGCCVGYKNLRYYYGLLIFIGVGGLYSTTLNQLYIWDMLGGFNLASLISHLFPFLFFMFGKLTFFEMCSTLLSLINFLGCGFAIGLLYYHGKLILFNQTTYESNKRITQYDLGDWRSNTVDSLGDNWLSGLLISPSIKSKLPGNGIDFASRKHHQMSSHKSK